MIVNSRFSFYSNRLTDSEEVIREHLRSLRQREAALNALEKENSELHDKVNLLVQEKSTISRELEKTKVSQSVNAAPPVHLVSKFCAQA